MHCPSCALSIEGELEDSGIKSSCNYPKQQIEVEVKDKDKEDLVKKIVNSLGYQIEKV